MKAVFGVVVDGAIMMIAFAAAIALRFDFQAPRWGWAATWQSFLTVAFVQLAMMIAFDCLRRANGNTLVSHLGAITEYTPDHQVAWRFECADAPELKLGNLCGLEERKNGNLVVGTYANGDEEGSRTTAFEVTRNKKIVWSYAAAGKRRSMMTAFLVPGWRWPIKWMPVTAAVSTSPSPA